MRLPFLRYFTQLFVSNTCYVCGRELVEQEKAVCLACRANFNPVNGHLQPTENEAFYLLGGRVDIAGATALYYYDKAGSLQRLIRQLKYEQAPQLGILLGNLLGETLRDSPLIGPTDAIVPVPLHPVKKIMRGYNQAERIATGLAEVLKLPVETNLIRRTRNTRSQTRKDQDARWRNVADAFAVDESAAGRHILLVDDVLTTGSTLVACGKTFFAAAHPPASLRVATVAMARSH